MPPVGVDDHDEPRGPDDDNPNRRLVRVTALAATASGDAIVGGAVRGPVQARRRRRSARTHGNARLHRPRRPGAARFRMIRLAERRDVHGAERAGRRSRRRIVVSYEDGSLDVAARRTAAHVWSRDLPPARALAFAPTRRHPRGRAADIDAHRESSQFSQDHLRRHGRHPATATSHASRPGARSAGPYRLDRGQQRPLLPAERPFRRRTARPGSRPRPGGDIYVAGRLHVVRCVPAQVDEPEPADSPAASWRASRTTARFAWSRLVASGTRTRRAGVTRRRLAWSLSPARSRRSRRSTRLARSGPGGVRSRTACRSGRCPIRRTPEPPPATRPSRTSGSPRSGPAGADFVCVGTYRAADCRSAARRSPRRTAACFTWPQVESPRRR